MMRTVIYFALALISLPRESRSLLSPGSGQHAERLHVQHLALQAKPKDASVDQNMAIIEREVMESTRAKLDLQRVTKTLLNDELPLRSSLTTWQVALAASGSGGAAAFFLLHNWILSGIVLVYIFVVANGDPLEEESIAGALARVVGRGTLQSLPKVRAIARAAVTGEDDIAVLKSRVYELEKENYELKLWKKRRLAVDQALPDYSLEELKEKARQNGLGVGGTKTQLLMRLAEVDQLP
jgi:hypothetical protein